MSLGDDLTWRTFEIPSPKTIILTLQSTVLSYDAIRKTLADEWVLAVCLTKLVNRILLPNSSVEIFVVISTMVD
jgi:hypothetical protein